MPKEYYGAALGEALAERILEEEKRDTGGGQSDLRRQRILIPRAKIGTQEIILPLEKAGISYKDLPIYNTQDVSYDDLIWYDETVDYVAFTSASTVKGFIKQNPDADYSQVKAICIGRQTVKEAEKYGMKIFMAKEPSIDSMVECLMELEGFNRV